LRREKKKGGGKLACNSFEKRDTLFVKKGENRGAIQEKYFFSVKVWGGKGWWSCSSCKRGEFSLGGEKNRVASLFLREGVTPESCVQREPGIPKTGKKEGGGSPYWEKTEGPLHSGAKGGGNDVFVLTAGVGGREERGRDLFLWLAGGGKKSAPTARSFQGKKELPKMLRLVELCGKETKLHRPWVGKKEKKADECELGEKRGGEDRDLWVRKD